MKNFKYLLIALVLFPSCQYLKNKFQAERKNEFPRSIAQTASNSHDHSTQVIKTFENLMSEPLFKPDEKGQLQPAFIIRVRKYVDRQFEFLYIGQSLMHKFDNELDRLVEVKKRKGKLSSEDTENLNLLYFQLQVARIVYEENLHELSDLYLMTLETRLTTDINGDVDLKKKTSLILSELPLWLNEATEKKYTIGAISVAEAIHEINLKFMVSTPAVSRYSINVDRFINLSKVERQKAYLESKDPKVLDAFRRMNAHIENSAQKRYEEEFDEQQKNPEKLMLPFFEDGEKPLTEEKRKTSSIPLDDLYPSADGHGHISGNRVPAKTWAMTFDDGPHPTLTQEMMKVMNTNKVPAMFLMLSKNMKIYPNIVAQMRANEKTNGVKFHVASHSMSHANLPTLKEKELEIEITEASQLFEKIVGEAPTFFRCPYGACGPMGSKIREIIAKNNMLHVHWNVDPLDWQDKNPQSIFERSKKQIDLRGKGIVLFHDVHPQSVEAVKLLLPYMKSKKYRMIGLPEMVSEIREKEYYSP